jgi:hypothetical protein
MPRSISRARHGRPVALAPERDTGAGVNAASPSTIPAAWSRGRLIGAWGFLALNALGALFVVGPLVAAWLFRPALGPTATERAEAEPSTS